MINRTRSCISLVAGCIGSTVGCVSAPKITPDAVASIPTFIVDSVIYDSAGTQLAALVGTIQDSASGRPLGGVQVILTSRATLQRYYSISDERGGFVAKRLRPAVYDLLIRNVGYRPYVAPLSLPPGLIDTLRIRLSLFPQIFTVSAVFARVHTSSPSPCLAPSQSSDDLLSEYQWKDTTTDANTVAWRQTFSLPSIPVGQLSLVSDTIICRRAVIAYNSALAAYDSRVTSAVNLLKYGPTRYVAEDTARKEGEWVFHVGFDSSFTQMLGITRH